MIKMKKSSSRSRTVLVILTITLGCLALCLAAFFTARTLVIEKIEDKVDRRLQSFGLKAEILPDSWLHPTCMKHIKISTAEDDQTPPALILSDVCLQDGALSALTSTPNLRISVQKLRGNIDDDLLEKLKNRHHSPQKTPHATTAPPLQAFVQFEDIDLRVGKKNQNITLKSHTASLEYGESIAFDADFSTSFDIQKSRIAFRNAPSLRLHASFTPAQKNASLQASFQPAIELAALWNEKNVELSLQDFSANIEENTWNLRSNHIQAELPQNLGRLKIDAIRANMPANPTSLNDVQTIRIERPELLLSVKDILNADVIRKSPLLTKLIEFWKQEPGAFIGEAPKKSVRRADVKKIKPKAPNNPIPKEDLIRVKNAFDHMKSFIQTLPAIEIEHGTLDLSHENANYILDNITFNTNSLFKNNQQFELQFAIQSASVDFTLAFPYQDVFAKASLNIQKLTTEDFLKSLNLPVPPQNDGFLSLFLQLQIDDTAFATSGNLEFQNFAFLIPKISPNLVHDINAKAAFNATYAFDEDALNIHPMTLDIGPASFHGKIHISTMRSDPIIDFQFSSNDIPCADIPQIIPKGLFPTITNLQLEGTSMSPSISGRIPWRDPLTATLKESGFSNQCFPVRVDPYSTDILNDKNFIHTTTYTYFADAIQVGPGSPSYTPLDKIPPYVKAAMFLTEDKRFFEHGPMRIGFIERALRLNLNQRKYVYGGSTIGQQLTKNLFLNRNKNLARKLEEAFITWHMLTYVPKSRVFELYLNVIEFGPDVYGIKNAAQFYFDKDPADLSPLEGAFLASLKVAPSKGGRFYKNGFPKDGKWWNKRLKYILKVLAENGYISVPQVLAAYTWIPSFVYPSQKDDPRAIWLDNYAKYLNEKAKEAKLHDLDAPIPANED